MCLPTGMGFADVGHFQLHTESQFAIQAAASENQQLAYAIPKAQISCAVTAQLISAFVFAEQIVQSLFFLNPKFQASSLLL